MTISRGNAKPAPVLRRVGRGARRISRRLGLRLQPRRTWTRVLSGVVGVGYLLVAFVALVFLDVPSGFHGWLPTTIGFTPGMLLLTIGMGIGRWPAAVAWAVVSALVMGSWMHYTAAPTHQRIEAEAIEVGAPAAWTVVEDGAWTGNTSGWGSLPEISYTYVTDDSVEVAAEDYAALLEAEGWEQDTDAYSVEPSPGTVAQAWEKGRWNVQVRVIGPGSRPRRFDTSVPAALTKIDLYFDGQR